MARAAASNRSEKVTLSLGILNVEVALFSTTVSDHGIERKMFVEPTNPDTGEVEEHEIGFVPFDKITGKPVERDKIVKKVATEYGFVFVEDDEIERLFTLEPRSLTVTSTHPMNHWRAGRLTSKRSWVMEAAPKQGSGKKKVPNRAGRISLRAVLDVLEADDMFAMGELVTRGKPKPVAILPSGEVHEIYYAEELREPRPAVELPAEDLAKAKAFHPAIGAMLDEVFSVEVDDPTDVRTAMIQQFADEKAKAGDFEKPEATEVKEVEASDDTDALLAALNASLEKKAPSKRKKAS